MVAPRQIEPEEIKGKTTKLASFRKKPAKAAGRLGNAGDLGPQSGLAIGVLYR